MNTVGIDLGTTNSVVAALTGERPEIVKVNGHRKTPSVVSFDRVDSDGGAVLVGERALMDQRMSPGQVVSAVKRHMGEDPEAEDAFAFEHNGETYNPQMVSSYVLRKLAAGAEDFLGTEVESAVVTVPADFSKNESAATKVAGAYAGLEIEKLLPEPTAACMAYGLSQEDTEFETVAVYDMGGGTFDISLVNIDYGLDLSGESEEYYDVQATAGKQRLGGEDLDEKLTEYVMDQHEEATGEDIREDPDAVRRLQQKVKDAKHHLSEAPSTKIREPSIGKEPIEVEIERETFDDLIADFVEDSIEVCEEVLETEGMTTADVDTVLLVGGSTHVPLVRERVEEFFGAEPSKEIDPDAAVAMGAAIEAARIEEKRLLAGEEGGSGRLPGGGSSPVAADALGVRVVNEEGGERRDRVHTLIDNNEDLPAKTVERGFTTAEDGHTEVKVQIYEGEAEYIDEEAATKIDEFTLRDLPSVPRSDIDIEIEFELDKSNLLHARAEEQNHGITGSTEVDEEGAEGEDFIVETEFLETRSTVDERREWMPPVKIGDRAV